jgi:Fe-S oxidoreductase
MDTIRRAITEGAREIILTGVNIGDFGNGSSERFIDLVRSIDDMTDEVRFRISSVEPNLLEDDIIRLIARSRRIAPHFHIPLQSGSNRVLELMQRRYTRDVFAQKVATIKSLMPHAFIGVDVIVGMRGETPDMFDETVQFLAETPFSELHIFPYSERKGTRALNISHVVSVQEKKRRSEILHRMSQEHVEEFYRSQKGLERTVLWETTKDPKIMSGYTENYIPVTAPFEAEKINTFQKIRID